MLNSLVHAFTGWRNLSRGIYFHTESSNLFPESQCPCATQIILKYLIKSYYWKS